MYLIQQRTDVVFNNESTKTDSCSSDDDSGWVSSPFQQFLHLILQVDKISSKQSYYPAVTPDPPEDVELQDNLKESNSAKECLKSIAVDHSYGLPHGFRRSSSNLGGNQPESVDDDDDETVDAHAKVEENTWNPVREVKKQFVLGTNLVNPLISSFDVACIEEYNPDGSPVDKMHAFPPTHCGVHGWYNEWCTMCSSQPPSKLVLRNARKGVHLRCIDNKVNCVPQVKSRKRKADESLDNVSENGENVNKMIIMKLIEDLGKKKRNKHPLICEICGKLFTAVATLKNHYRSHGNIKLYTCPICNSSFTRKFGLRYHMQIHSNKYRYTCSECSRKFRHTTHYKAHCRDHSSGKPLQCTLCPSSFKNRNTLNRHVKTKHLSSEELK